MKLLTRQILARGVAAAWKKQYRLALTGGYDPYKHAQKYQQIVQLGPSPTPEQIEQVIGVNGHSWVDTCCDECGMKNLPVVKFGKSNGLHEPVMCICLPCIERATNMLRQARHTETRHHEDG